MEQRAYPTYLHLPERKAELIHGSAAEGKPRYHIDGVEIECDTTIPADLLKAGWYWWGSSLCWRNEAAGNQACLIGIADPRALLDYYESARIVERTRAEIRTARTVKPQKPVKRVKPQAVILQFPKRTAMPVQEVMEL